MAFEWALGKACNSWSSAKIINWKFGFTLFWK